MTATITALSGVVEAFAEVTTTKTSQKARTKQHEILDGPPVFTLRDAASRQAKMKFVGLNAADAETLREIFATGQVATVSDPGQPNLLSPIVLIGDLEVELDRRTANRWIVTAEVAEVP